MDKEKRMNIKVDEEGVPLLVQSVKWNTKTRVFELGLFNGHRCYFSTTALMMPPVMGAPNPAQFVAAQDKGTALLLDNWRDDYGTRTAG